ncbi:MAG TPA: mandelate racemase/muconate lactonizing enzyme family protein [Caulobacteraceae bacterium]|nr:mandelate racemase/muconate lactonizing enzyme family protein [Caulobacteraceae bacterium]
MSEHKIASIAISHHRLPLDPPFNASWDTSPRHQFDATIVRVTTDTGLTGVGSGDLMLGFSGHEPLFVGRDPTKIERHHTVLSHLDFHYGRCWPLDLALWDLIGQIERQPCWRLLGGASGRVRAYVSSGVLRGPAAMADAAERFLEAGFGAMKIRFHRGDWRDDIRALEAVRDGVGDRLELMADCNQGWRMPWDTEPPWTLAEALPVARELERLGAYWMEEPLHRCDYAGLAELRAAVGVRIAGGEMNREASEFRDLIERGCLDVLQPDVALAGGITGVRRVAEAAIAAGLMFSPHTWTNGLGVVANAHLAAGLGATPFLEFPYDPPEWSLERRDFMLARPFAAGPDGWLTLSQAPGLGVELNEPLLAQTRIR